MGKKGNSTNTGSGRRNYEVLTVDRDVDRAASNGIYFKDGSAYTYPELHAEGTPRQVLAAAEILVNHLAQHPGEARTTRRHIQALGGVQSQIAGSIVTNRDGTQSRVLRPGYDFDSGRGFQVRVPPILGRPSSAPGQPPAPLRARSHQVQTGHIIEEA